MAVPVRLIDAVRGCVTGVVAAMAAACLAPAHASEEIVFLDAGVSEAEVLERAVAGAELIRLDAGRDPLVQMAEAMAGRRDVSAIHLISHGAPGTLAFAGGRVNMDALRTGAGSLSAIRVALAADADVHLYACNVAQGDTGERFAAGLAAALDADLAASTTPSGAWELGGDWALEWRLGELADSPVRAALSASGYRGVLQAIGSQVVVDFNGVGFANVGPTVTSNNFEFAFISTNAGAEWYTLDTGGEGNSGYIETSHISALGAANVDTVRVQHTTPGTTFDFSSFWYNIPTADYQIVSIEGFLGGVSQGTYAGVPLGAGSGTVNLGAAFDNVDEVVFTSGAEGFTFVGFDTFVFDPPPSDTTAPRVTSVVRQTPATEQTNTDTLIFRVTFDEGVQNVDTTDFSPTNTSATATNVTANSTSEYDVTVSGGDLAGFDGTVGLGFAGGFSIQDLAGNALSNTTPTGSNETYTLDNTAPALTAFARNTPATSPTNADTLVFDITFDGSVQNVTANDFTVSGTTATGVLAGSGAAYTLTVSGGDLASLNGTVGLDLAGGQTITDAVGNPLPAGEPATDETYTLNNTAPRVTSVVRQTPATEQTNSDTLIFRVTFDEGVQNVDTTDFSPTNTSATATTVTANSTSEYDVTVSGGDLAGFDGTVGLGFAGGFSIQDLAGNALSNTTPTGSNETYTLDNTAPALTAFARNTPATSPTNADTLVFDITFDGSVQNVTADDFTVSGTTATGVLAGSGAAYTLTVSGGDLASLNGTVGLDLAGGQDIADAADNPLPAGEPATDETYTLNNTAPRVTSVVRQTPATEQTNTDTLVFRVTFDMAVQNVDTADFSPTNTSATATNVTANSTSEYDVTVSGGDLAGFDGTVGLGFAGGFSIQDLAGNALSNTTPTGSNETYTLDNTAPALTAFARNTPATSPTNADTLVFDITFDGSVQNVTADDFTVSGTTAPGVLTGSGAAYTLTISGGDLASLNGAVGLDLAGGQDIADAADNPLPAGEPATDETYTVDNTAPSGYSAVLDQDPVTSANETAVSFTFSGAEMGADYAYSISSSGGGGPVTGSGTIATVTDRISGIDVSSLTDGTLTLSVTLTDTGGNTGSAATDTATKDTSAPSGYLATIDQDPVTSANETAVSFTFAGAEVGADYAYSISSSGGGGPVTGSGTIATVTDRISGIDVSSLTDGTLTLSVTLTDPEGNTGAAATDTATKDASAPSGYSVTFDQSAINSANEGAVSFTFAGAEVGADYAYTISSTGGGGPVTGSGTIATATDRISGVDVSSLTDGTLTLSVTLTDTQGNAGTAATDTATKDTSAPAGHSVSFDQDPVNSANETAISFTFAGAEVGADYAYTISSSGGGGPVTGSGTIATATDRISGIDVSSLTDGTLTLSVTLTDTGGNTGSAATDTASKDASAPSGYSVAFDQDPVTSADEAAVSFTFAGAEAGSDYTYSISSSGGGGPVTGSGTIATATDQISGIDVSSLADGTLTLSVTLTDTGGNTGAAATDTATKDSSAPAGYSVSFDQDPVTSANETAVSFTFAGAEVGADYVYSISSSGGGGPVTGSGTIATASHQISGIDVSSLADGTLTLSVTVTDTGGNTGAAVTDTANKDATASSGYSVAFDQDPVTSANETAVSFTFAGAEVGADYAYTISSTGGGGPVTGSGTIATATDQISGIDVSSLADGTLTLSVTLTDTNGNTGPAATDTASKDVAAPSGYSVAFDQDPVTSTSETAVSFTFAGAEVGADYAYSISSSGGGGPVAGSGTIATATDQISGIDVSSLADGTLTLSVTLTDTGGNTGSAATDTSAKETDLPGFAKDFSPASIMAGGTSTLTFTIDNSSSGVAATALDFQDSFPSGMTIASAPNASTTCTGGTIGATAGADALSYSGGGDCGGCILHGLGRCHGYWQRHLGEHRRRADILPRRQRNCEREPLRVAARPERGQSVRNRGR